jgi:hypothetical protein
VRQPIPGALAVTLTYDVSGQPAQVVLGCAGVDGGFGTVEDAQALANLFHTNARALMATSCTLTAITARVAVPDGAVFGLALPATNLTGTAAGNLVTAYATLIRWNTAKGGRSGRGRTYVPGFTTGGMAADGRTLSSTNLTAANALGNAMVNATGPAGSLNVLSYTDGEASPVTSFSVSSIVGVQRRRIRN